MVELVCIVCPKGCRLKVDDKNGYAVSGNSCERGAEYGKNEVTNPTRVITSTIICRGGEISRCPVKTQNPVPKGNIFDIMEAINGASCEAPVKIGDIILENIANTGVNLVATKNIERG